MRLRVRVSVRVRVRVSVSFAASACSVGRGWALGTASLWAPRNVNHKLGILEFNITIADIHTGARFPADCTNRADVAAADPRLDPVSHPPADV